eukprot:TRINITY_DN49767_c0_g1_i1.p1 TRINITY_DN49767_c0_g1~~TRINITY_DN49767_c0_g1_i1.p1  ORF type:complete len:511 (-),score=66.97 TRINITY_DN49767_c0_g1_i1:69-1601(-)
MLKCSDVLLVLLVSPRYAQAQIYSFLDDDLPSNKTSFRLYDFSVFSAEDAPGATSASPLPFIKFDGLFAMSTVANPRVNLETYVGIQLVFMLLDDYLKSIESGDWCSGPDDVMSGAAKHQDMFIFRDAQRGKKQSSQVNWFVHTVRFRGSSNEDNDMNRDVKKTIPTSGTYVLLLVNCGEFSEGTISGTVIVKNSHGFLPANAYSKLMLYGWLIVVYIFSAVLWLFLSIRWWNQLVRIHLCIISLILLSLFEAFMWYLFLDGWNRQGVYGKIMQLFTVLLTAAKCWFSYMLVLVASMGWGVTQPFLSREVVKKLSVLSCLYVFGSFLRFVVSINLWISLNLLKTSMILVTLLNVYLIEWAIRSLSDTITLLKERKQAQRLVLFQRLRYVVVIALAGGTLSLLYEYFFFGDFSVLSWHYDYLFKDCLINIVFFFVLFSMMILWAPNKDSQHIEYSQQLDKSGHRQGAVWADEDAVDDGDDVDESDSFWSATKQVGADLPEADMSVIGGKHA